MDGNRFDALARAWSLGSSRRSVIRGALAVVLAGSAVTADAQAHPRRQTCRPPYASCLRSSDCCSGLCDTRRSTPRNRRNRCACSDGLSPCNGVCVDQLGDDMNCGGCGNVCTGQDTCISGVCTCIPQCDGKECGDDGCGGSCGECDALFGCKAGACVEYCTDFANNPGTDECMLSVENEEVYSCGFSWELEYGLDPCTTSEECRTRSGQQNAYCSIVGADLGDIPYPLTPYKCWVNDGCK